MYGSLANQRISYDATIPTRKQSEDDTLSLEPKRKTFTENQRIAKIAKSLPGKLVQNAKEIFKSSKPILPFAEPNEYVVDLER